MRCGHHSLPLRLSCRLLPRRARRLMSRLVKGTSAALYPPRGRDDRASATSCSAPQTQPYIASISAWYLVSIGLRLSFIVGVGSSPPAGQSAGMIVTICHHMRMARIQTLVQLSDQLLAQLDARAVREGRNRSDLIREALVGYLATDREAEIDHLIVESYTAKPQEALLDVERLGRAMIAAEPWEPSRRGNDR